MTRKSIIYILITAFCFGTMEVALKLGGSAYTSLQMNFLRFLIGGIVLLPLAVRDARKRGLHLSISDWGYLALLGIVGVCISMSFFQIGVMRMNANTASVIISCNPVFTMIFAHFLVHDTFSRRKALVLLISIIGLVFVANPVHMAVGNTPYGLFCLSVALITFALYTALGKMRAAKLGGIVQTCFPFLIASVINFIVLLVMGEPVFDGITLHTCPVLLYCGFVVTGIGYLSYLCAIEMVGPSNASIAFFLKPVIAVTAAAIILHETVTWNIILGIVLILLGLCINMKKTR